MGQGSPTILCESGLGDTSQTWSTLQSRLSLLTTVCSYDRAGLGHSDPAPVPRTLKSMVRDLAVLLGTVQLPPPYVLVGHSFGGLLVRLYASQHPAAVAGIVLIDSSHEEKEQRFESVLQGELRQRHRAAWHDPAKNAEQVDRRRSSDELRQAPRHFAVPLLVLTRGRPLPLTPPWPPAALAQIEKELQQTLLAESPQSHQIIATESGHFIHHDEPELVIQLLQQMVDAIRRSTQA